MVYCFRKCDIEVKKAFFAHLSMNTVVEGNRTLKKGAIAYLTHDPVDYLVSLLGLVLVQTVIVEIELMSS